MSNNTKNTQDMGDSPSTLNNISLDLQRHAQRNFTFWFVVIICSFLYLSALGLIFCGNAHFESLLKYSSYAVFIPITLLVLPTITIGILARMVYGAGKRKNEDEDPLNYHQIVTTVLEKCIDKL